jgi:hypothetical protein
MAFIAQLVEHTAVNRKVHSSNLCESAFFVCNLMCLSYLIIKQLENYEYTRPKALKIRVRVVTRRYCRLF